MFNCKYANLAIIVCLFFLSGCNNEENSTDENINKLFFHPSYNGVPLTCDSVISLSNKQWHYNQLQFFISAIEFKDHKNKWQKTSLLTTPYQTETVALLGEHCDYSKLKDNANWALNFDSKSPLANATHIRFTLGVPFTINHLNPLTQKSPLNIPTMFWGWQKGHKFLRLEMASNNDNWLFHLGSVGCSAASPLRSPKEECRYPNRYIFELPISKKNNQIMFELNALLNALTVTEQSSCQSSPDNDSCKLLFENLTNHSNNSVFSSFQNSDTSL